MNTVDRILKIGTRGSPLAMMQAHMVRDALKCTCPDIEIEIVKILTSGDWRPSQGENRLNTDNGGKGQFAKEIESALLDREIDIAVHSMKDMETHLPEGLQIHHMLPREDARDVLIINSKNNKLTKNSQNIKDLPQGLKIGTASVRRQAMLLAMRDDLEVVPIRGNVHTRLDKLNAGQVDGTLLALAGLKRLGLYASLEKKGAFIIDCDEMVPAAGQGAVGIEMRIEDDHIATLLNDLSCITTVMRVAAERATLAVLDGSCHTPIGCYATLNDDVMHIRGAVAALDGSSLYKDEVRGAVRSVEDAQLLGRALGEALRIKVPPALFMQYIEE